MNNNLRRPTEKKWNRTFRQHQSCRLKCLIEMEMNYTLKQALLIHGERKKKKTYFVFLQS